jgi:hypothetical protein
MDRKTVDIYGWRFSVYECPSRISRWRDRRAAAQGLGYQGRSSFVKLRQALEIKNMKVTCDTWQVTRSGRGGEVLAYCHHHVVSYNIWVRKALGFKLR